MRRIDDVRDEIIGLKVIDIEPQGRAIHLEDEEGRSYSIDFTGRDGAVVYRGLTEKEEIENKLMLFDLLLQKLDISQEEGQAMDLDKAIELLIEKAIEVAKERRDKDD